MNPAAPDRDRPVLLVHGGLWENMDADRFWVRPGIVAGLRDRGYTVLAPDRLRRPPTWAADVDHIAAGLPDRPVVVVAGSNGCSVAVRLAQARPGRVRALVLAWPATAGDPRIDTPTRERLLTAAAAGTAAASTVAAIADGLLAGETLRGVSDVELAGLTVPVAVLPSEPDNPVHQRTTVDALLALVPGAVALPGCPEAPRSEFPRHLEAFSRR